MKSGNVPKSTKIPACHESAHSPIANERMMPAKDAGQYELMQLHANFAMRRYVPDAFKDPVRIPNSRRHASSGWNNRNNCVPPGFTSPKLFGSSANRSNPSFKPVCRRRRESRRDGPCRCTTDVFKMVLVRQFTNGWGIDHAAGDATLHDNVAIPIRRWGQSHGMPTLTTTP